MVQNYFRVALRHLLRDKTQSSINVVGLAIGMAVALLIGLWMNDELSFDRNFARFDRIAQVYTNNTIDHERGTGISVPIPLANELRTHYGSNFRYVVMSTWNNGHILSVNSKNSDRKVITFSGSYMESQAPNLLSLEMLAGTRDGLKQGNALFLSQRLAAALFGRDNPMGKVVKVDNQTDFTVTGVYSDLPTNSSFNGLGFIGSWQGYVASNPWINQMQDPWSNNGWQIFVEIAPHTTMASVSAAIRDAKNKNVKADEKKDHYALFLHPMSQWHLWSEYKDWVNTGGRIQYVWLFGLIGVFVLILACINFMNLSTARSEQRAKEVGIRKVIGSRRLQLIFQFFAESLLLTVLAFGIALLLVNLSLNLFNQIAGKSMGIPWSSPFFWFAGIGFCFLTGLIAGSYPAFYLSSFRPVRVLKGAYRAGRFASLPRQALVVLQFTISVSLIIGTIAVFRQIQFAKERSVGYDKNRLVMVPRVGRDIHKHFDVVKNELKSAGVVTEMAEADAPVTSVWATNSGFDWEGKDPSLAVDIPNTGISPDYGKTVGWKLVAGRDFSNDFPTDSVAFIVNESAVKLLGMKDPIGKTIKWDGYPFHIIGVVKDIVNESPYAPVRPSFYCTARGYGDIVILRIPAGTNMQTALDKCKAVFTRYSSDEPFSYFFADEDYAKKFGDEQRIEKLAGVFAALAILISCLGLFGMASFTAERRTRELGVRKVLGATVINLWGMLSKEFLKLTGISLLIAVPLSYYFMEKWLEGYAYHCSLSWSVFAYVTIGISITTLLTVSYHSLKAALMNPVKSLRSE